MLDPRAQRGKTPAQGGKMAPQHGLFSAPCPYLTQATLWALHLEGDTGTSWGLLGRRKACCEFKKNMDSGSRRECCGLDGSLSFPCWQGSPKQQCGAGAFEGCHSHEHVYLSGSLHRVTQQKSPSSLCVLLVLCWKLNTRRVIYPELCFHSPAPSFFTS